MSEGISQREFARRDGCTPKTVRDRIAVGALQQLADGKIDPSLVGTNWRKRNVDKNNLALALELDDAEDDPLQDNGIIDGEISDSIKKRADRLMLSNGFVMLETVEAERKKQNYLALRQELAYDKEASKVVVVDEILEEIAAQLGRVRALLLGIPVKVAPMIIGCKTAEDAKYVIEREIVFALAEITDFKG